MSYLNKQSGRFPALYFIFLALGILLVTSNFAQTQRNPVLEYVTGTWCGYCPQGHQIIQNDILPNIPNAIIIGYHGPANGSDPFSFFPGNTIISAFGFNAYPTGVVDRVSGIISRGSWFSQMNSRTSVPATVKIDMIKSFDPITRQFTAYLDFTALANLSGQFRYNVILLEDGMVWAQTNGGSNYVHRHVVRAMMNGALGTEIVNGTWNQGQMLSDTLQYVVPVPGGPGPDIVWDSCHVAVLVYKNGSPLSSNAEIQQAEQWPLIDPDYVGMIESESPDVIADNTTPATFSVVLKNVGLQADLYYLNLNMAAPAGWTAACTTPNGTFTLGQTDSLEVTSGDSVQLSVTVNPNGLDGAGETVLKFVSKNYPVNQDSVLLRNVTTTGIDILVVDAEDKDYEQAVVGALNRVSGRPYGVVSRTALRAPGVDLGHFKMLTWSAGTTFPAFVPEEVSALQTYLDNGGRLFINGQDIGRDIFGPNGLSSFAQSFYQDYLKASYVADASNFFLIKGVSGDPIGDGLQFVVNNLYEKSLDKIQPFDSTATGFLVYFNMPNIAAIRTETAGFRVVYLAFGFEQIGDAAAQDSLLARSIRWLTGTVSGIGDGHRPPTTFTLYPNYPNPFNPVTRIKFELPQAGRVTLDIFNPLGQKVRELINEQLAAGAHQTVWDGKNDRGEALPSGIYLYKITSGRYRAVRKMILMK